MVLVGLAVRHPDLGEAVATEAEEDLPLRRGPAYRLGQFNLHPQRGLLQPNSRASSQARPKPLQLWQTILFSVRSNVRRRALTTQ